MGRPAHGAGGASRLPGGKVFLTVFPLKMKKVFLALTRSSPREIVRLIWCDAEGRPRTGGAFQVSQVRPSGSLLTVRLGKKSLTK